VGTEECAIFHCHFNSKSLNSHGTPDGGAMSTCQQTLPCHVNVFIPLQDIPNFSPTEFRPGTCLYTQPGMMLPARAQ
jgi:hypothetical protein